MNLVGAPGGLNALVFLRTASRTIRLRRIYLRPASSLIIIAALSACTSQPIVRVQYVNIPTYIPYPVTLTQPISVNLAGDTWGKAVGDLKAGLETCDGQLQAIKDLKVPPKTP